MFGNFDERVSELTKSVLLTEHNLFEKSKKIILVLNQMGIDPDRGDVMVELRKVHALLFDMEYYHDLKTYLHNITTGRRRTQSTRTVDRSMTVDPKPFLEYMNDVRREMKEAMPDFTLLLGYVMEKVTENPTRYVQESEYSDFWGTDEETVDLIEKLVSAGHPLLSPDDLENQDENSEPENWFGSDFHFHITNNRNKTSSDIVNKGHNIGSISCHDGSISPILVYKTALYTLDLYAVSDVHGMGDAEYETYMFGHSFSEIVVLAGQRGLSYLCLKKEGKWALAELRDDMTPQCALTFLSGYEFDNEDDLLHHFSIDSKPFDYKCFWGNTSAMPRRWNEKSGAS